MQFSASEQIRVHLAHDPREVYHCSAVPWKRRAGSQPLYHHGQSGTALPGFCKGVISDVHMHDFNIQN